MKSLVNLKSNKIKFIFHGYFFSSGISVAEPSTILPLIVNYFTGSNLLVGVFSSLLRGGSVVMQLYAAFFAQAYTRVMKQLRIIFFFRFISWFFIAVSLYFFGPHNKTLTLWLFGIGLFSFSFTAGFGSVYFHELIGKSFTPDYRGNTMAVRQFFAGIGGILSGLMVGKFLNMFEPPYNFAYIFLISSCFMLMGYLFLGSVKEGEKLNVSHKEEKFSSFLHNASRIFIADKKLSLQIYSRLLSFSYLFVFPFIVIQAKKYMSLGGLAMGTAIPLLTGALVSNLFWKKLAGNGKNRYIALISFVLIIISLILALISTSNIWVLMVLFFLAGSAGDGFKLSYGNLVLNISPEDKRPVYLAIQNNLTSLGMFFSIPGGAMLKYIGFQGLTLITLALLLTGLILSFNLSEQ